MARLRKLLALGYGLAISATSSGQPLVRDTGLSVFTNGFRREEPRMSGDATTIAGTDGTPFTVGGLPWFWRTSHQNGVKTGLDLPVGGDFARVAAISHSGAHVFGAVQSHLGNSPQWAVRWNIDEGGFQAFPPPLDCVYCSFTDCSDDGGTAVAVAIRQPAPDVHELAVFLWTEAAGFEEIVLPDGRGPAWYPIMSGDARFVCAATNTNEILRWSRATGWTVLATGASTGFKAQATDISRDGSAIIATFEHQSVPFLSYSVRWDESSGVLRVPALSPCMPNQASARVIDFISHDGSRMVGYRNWFDATYWLPGLDGLDSSYMIAHMYQSVGGSGGLGRAVGMSSNGLTIMAGNPLTLTTIQAADTFPNWLEPSERDYRWLCMHQHVNLELRAFPRVLNCAETVPSQWYRYRAGTEIAEPLPEEIGPSVMLRPILTDNGYQTMAGRYFFVFGELRTPDYHVGCLADYLCHTPGAGIDDLFGFMNDWFAGSSATDLDRDLALTTQDLMAYIHEWFRGCEMSALP